MTVLVLLGVVVAVAAAARSTWSPCGLSVLSTITPFAERSRGHRFWATSAWLVAGATAGGLTLGGAAALMWWAGPVHGGAQRGLLVGAAVVSVAAALIDAGAFGPVLPLIRRQVDDGWLVQYRPWVYGSGYGWQLGVGLATYLMTAGVVVVVVIAALAGVEAGSAWPALAVGGAFGAARGLTVLIAGRAVTPDRLRVLHGRLDAWGPAVRRVVIGVLLGAGIGLLAVAVIGDGSMWPPLFGAAAGGIGLFAAGRARSTLSRAGAG